MTGKLISTDKRVPVEVWEKIFTGLYPSQLSRLSIVSKTFYSIITSLPIWSRLFTLTHPKQELRVLRGRSVSSCCMIYMCAVSLHFCEECQKLVPFQKHNPSHLPLPVFVTQSNTPAVTTTFTNAKAVTIAGNRVDYNWRIRRCRDCRDPASAAESLPPWETSLGKNRTKKLPEWKLIYPQLHHVKIPGHLEIKPDKYSVISHLNTCLGGPAGVEAAKNLTKDYDAKTWSRIVLYQSQD